MKALVVYESLWGNTAAIAKEVAAGIGPEAEALTTEAATPQKVAEADLIVAGGPVLGFRLGTEQMRATIAQNESNAPKPPDLEHESLRSWLETIPHRAQPVAAFETRIWWSPRGATGDIEQLFRRAGYRPIAKPQKFVVNGKYGPLREGELERARRWGATLRAHCSPA
jgi:flavorubredoxin